MTQTELEAVWDGRLIVLMTKRAPLTDLGRRFDVTWFLGAIHKYRRLLSEVLLASFFLQLFSLVTPLFFQVVIDKVLVHRSMSTLDVLVIGLVAIAVFDTILGILRPICSHITPLQERVEIRRTLFNRELGSKLLYLSELQDLVGQRNEIIIQESRLRETEAAIAALVETRSKTVAEYERGLFDELSKAEQKAAGLAQDVIKAKQRTSLQKLTAPVDGVVQQLAIHTIGGVVTPAQALMVVVPAGTHLEIEAMVSNRDIGFVEPGQDAAIKIDTFNFTRYGLLHGKVMTVSHDAIAREKPPERLVDKPQGAESTSSEPKGQELVYSARVSLDRTYMQVEDKQVSLSPGMAVTVEIKTGTRRIISYLLSPLIRYKHESLRER